jgi:hypothetical protein
MVTYPADILMPICNSTSVSRSHVGNSSPWRHVADFPLGILPMIRVVHSWKFVKTWFRWIVSFDVSMFLWVLFATPVRVNGRCATQVTLDAGVPALVVAVCGVVETINAV